MKKDIRVGNKLYDEFGNEYEIKDVNYNDTDTVILKRVDKVVTGYVNIFYDKNSNQLTTGITYTDLALAVSNGRNGRFDTSYVKTIEINNQIEGEK